MLEDPPCKVRVPKTIWVVDAGKVKVAVELEVFVRLLKVVEPVTVWSVPLKLTVPELWVKVPAVLVKLPATVRVPEGAVNVSEEPSVLLRVRLK